ncbi:ATP/GTP-binding protein [Pseudomonadota bacterium]
MNNRKLAFIGPVGVGKTTAIKLLAGNGAISTEEAATDTTHHRKKTTTVAMDFGVMTLANGEQIRLYGTPGQERFNFMWDILATDCDGFILLLDNSRSSPLLDLSFFINNFKKYGIEEKLVVGITKSDVKHSLDISKYQTELESVGLKPAIHMIDARCPKELMKLVNELMPAPTNISYKLELQPPKEPDERLGEMFGYSEISNRSHGLASLLN